jgi:hypothetical protein
MKKLTLIALVFLGMSCTKEETCNCGLIVSDDVADYSIDIRNGCSGNVKTFNLSEGDWLSAHPGDDYCISNIDKW